MWVGNTHNLSLIWSIVAYFKTSFHPHQWISLAFFCCSFWISWWRPSRVLACCSCMNAMELSAFFSFSRISAAIAVEWAGLYTISSTVISWARVTETMSSLNYFTISAFFILVLGLTVSRTVHLFGYHGNQTNTADTKVQPYIQTWIYSKPLSSSPPFLHWS